MWGGVTAFPIQPLAHPPAERCLASSRLCPATAAAVLQPFDVVRTMQQGLAAQGHGAGR